MVETRPDIAFAILVISGFVKNLFWQYIEAMKTIMHYLKATKTVVIIYGNGEGSGNLIIKGYSNSNWVGDYACRKLTSGFIFILNRDSVS